MHMADMNKWMREKAGVLLVVICVVIMITWLVPWNYLFQKSPGPQGKIFGKVVPAQEVDALAMTISSLRQPRPSVEQARAQAWKMLILAEEAKRYGIIAGDDEVAELLKARFPAESGMGYNAREYAAFLEQARLTEQTFESSVKTVLAASTLSRTVVMAVTLPEDEAWLWYARDNERVMADYIALRAETLAPLVVADDKSVQEFYEEHKNTPPERDANDVGYLEPEEVSIEYVLCPFSRYLDSVVVTQRQVNAYYDAHKDEYRVRVPPQEAKPDEPAKFKPLSEVAPQIEADLRKEEAMRVVDEDMKEVNDEIATQTEVPFGSEEVRAADFAGIAKKFNLVHQITPLFPADKAGLILPGANDLGSKAFGQSVSNIRRPSVTLEARDGKYIFQIVKIQDPRPAPFEAIRKQVEKDYRTEKGYELAQELADQAMKDNPSSLDAAAAKILAAVAERLKALASTKDEIKKDARDFVQRGKSDFFARPKEYMGYRFAMRIGLPGDYDYSNFADEAFALKDNEVGKALEPAGARAVFLLKRIAVKPADRAEFEKNIAGITEDLLLRKRETVNQTWLADVRRAAQPSQEVMNYLGTQMQ
ncbi:MAG: SurA N-terminal domain-containing protein [Candidatus Brocadiia bacterium]